MGQKLKIQYRKLSELVPYDKNSRTHSDEQVQQVAASIKRFGFTNPILVDENGGLIAGHARFEAARQSGMEEVPTITLTGLTEDERRAYVIADNKLGELSGWNEDLLRAELQHLRDGDFKDLDVVGLSTLEIDDMLSGAGLGSGGNDGGGNGGGGLGTPVIQYNIIFETDEQQQSWFSFLRWLKDQRGEETIGARLAGFVEEHGYTAGAIPTV